MAAPRLVRQWAEFGAPITLSSESPVSDVAVAAAGGFAVGTWTFTAPWRRPYGAALTLRGA
jgi:hypothetical protein